ncbi:hypothetical protein D3C80_2149300 [compost metagenome]
MCSVGARLAGEGVAEIAFAGKPAPTGCLSTFGVKRPPDESCADSITGSALARAAGR